MCLGMWPVLCDEDRKAQCVLTSTYPSGVLNYHTIEPYLYLEGVQKLPVTIHTQLNCNNIFKSFGTEWGGSMVTHETRIREVPGSNPGADQTHWGIFVVFLSHRGKCWVGFSLPRSIWPLFIRFIYHKIKISELNKWNIDNTTEIHSLLVHTQRP